MSRSKNILTKCCGLVLALAPVTLVQAQTQTQPKPRVAQRRLPAQDASTSTGPVAAPAARSGGARFSTIGVSYATFQEKARFQQADAQDQGWTNLFGEVFSVQREIYFRSRHGVALEFTGGNGRATIANAQSAVPYETRNVGWWSVGFSPRYAYRVARAVTISAGGLLMYRSLSPINDPDSDVVATSGASFNYGYLGSVELQFTDDWTLRTQLAGLQNSATTYWSFGVAFRL